MYWCLPCLSNKSTITFTSLLACFTVTLPRVYKVPIQSSHPIVSFHCTLIYLPICRHCQWQRVKFLSMIWHKMSATQLITEQRPSTAQDSLSKWALLRRNCIVCHNLSLTDWHLLTGWQIRDSLFLVKYMNHLQISIQ